MRVVIVPGTNHLDSLSFAKLIATGRRPLGVEVDLLKLIITGVKA